MSGKDLRDTLATFGVIASLVFVGVEIRQNTQTARLAARQALMDHQLMLNQSVLEDESLHAEMRQWLETDPTTAPDLCPGSRICTLVRLQLRFHEDVFLQTQEGLIDEASFRSYGYRGQSLYASPHLRTVWMDLRHLLHPDFVAAFEAEYGLAN